MAVEYRVELDVYNGPLDLLLYLIKRDELDIYDIPIARITASYMAYLDMLRSMRDRDGLDIDLAGEFLVMAATLMEIKSAMLLPRPEPGAGGEESAAAELADPRYELVQRLLEYKRFKDAAQAMERRRELFASRFPRRPASREGATDEPPPLDLEEVQVWDLLEAFNRLMQEVGMRLPDDHQVIYDDTPIDLHAADIEDRVRREGRVLFRQLMEGRSGRSEMIGVFLALLELIRQKRVIIFEDDHEDDIVVIEAPEEHRRAAFEQPPAHAAGDDATRDRPDEPAVTGEPPAAEPSPPGNPGADAPARTADDRQPPQ